MYTAVPANGRLAFPPPRRSRISPPVPVAAPLKGSTVVGKLCVSAFSESTVSIFFVSKKSGLLSDFGANCYITGPWMKATLSLYAETKSFGLSFEVCLISWKSVISFSSPSITNCPLKILWRQCSEFT